MPREVMDELRMMIDERDERFMRTTGCIKAKCLHHGGRKVQKDTQ